MFVSLKKINNLIDKKYQIKFLFHFFITFILMVLEIAGLAILYPLVKMITDNEIPFQNLIPVSEEYFLYFFSFTLLTIFLLKNFLLIYFNLWQFRFLGKIHLSLASKLIKNYLMMPYKNYLDTNSSTLIRNIDETQSFTTYLNGILNILIEAIIIFAIFILLLRIDFLFTICAALIIILVSLIFYFSTKYKLMMWSKERIKLSRKTLKEIIETFNSTREIKTYKKEDQFISLNKENLSKQINISIKTNLLKIIPKSIYEICFVFLICTLILFINFSKTPLIDMLPTLSIFVAAGIKLIPSGNKILNQYQLIRLNKLSVEILNSEFKKEINKDKTYQKKQKYIENFVLNDLKIKNVSFAFKDKSILENVNLKFEKGKIYGIIGPSGSGKTTLANLILGLLDYSKGEIKINEKYDLSEIKNSYQSFLPQRIFLLDSSIKSNITFSYNVSQENNEKIHESLKSSKLDEIINDTNKILSENVGENAVKLSGGQMQRLAIARAIYHEAQLIVFDEPTSSLDTENARKIFENISSLKQNKILIVISHSDEISNFVDHTITIKNKIVTFN